MRFSPPPVANTVSRAFCVAGASGAERKAQLAKWHNTLERESEFDRYADEMELPRLSLARTTTAEPTAKTPRDGANVETSQVPASFA